MQATINPTSQLSKQLKKKDRISNIIIAVVATLVLCLTVLLAFVSHYRQLYYSLNEDGVTYTYKAPKTKKSKIDIPTKIKGSEIKHLGVWSYSNSSNLVEVSIPEGYESIGMCAFENCVALNKIVIPSTVKSIGKGAFNNTAYYNNESNWDGNALYVSGWLIAIKETEEPISITVKEGTIGIADGVFSEKDNVESVIVADSVLYLGNKPFFECKELNSVVVGDGVQEISNEAFYGCKKLTNVVIGKNVSKIGNYAFQDCTHLSYAEFKDATTWYYTTDSSYANGKAINLSDSTKSPIELYENHFWCYWYKV